MTGDRSHICWDCSVLQGFWKDMKEEIEKIMKIAISMDLVLF